MGFLLDLLKDVPLSANLLEKVRSYERDNAALKTENAILKDDLREARSRIKELETKLGVATQKPDLHEHERAILRYLFRTNVDHILSSITADLGFSSPQEAKYYLEKLVERGFINLPPRRSVVHRFPQYTLRQPGREYVIENNLMQTK